MREEDNGEGRRRRDSAEVKDGEEDDGGCKLARTSSAERGHGEERSRERSHRS